MFCHFEEYDPSPHIRFLVISYQQICTNLGPEHDKYDARRDGIYTWNHSSLKNGLIYT